VRVDSAGKQVCEDCGKRLSRCKGKLHNSGAGKICQSCYNKARNPSSVALPAASASPAAFQRSHKRRAESDPGEPLGARSPSPPSVRPSTHRVTPPTPIAAHKKQRTTRQDDRIMRLLDETHARRMATTQQEQ
jgi:hypothetical protein